MKRAVSIPARTDVHRTVVEDLTETICRFLPDGTFTFVNDAFCRVFGKQAEELVGRSWHPVAVEDDVPMIEERLRSLSPQTPVVVIENRIYDAEGRIRWMQFVNRAFFDADGKLMELQAVGRELDKRPEPPPDEALQRWRMALESSGFGVWDWDQKRNTVFYSTQWRAMLGYGRDDQIPDRIEDWQAMVHPEDATSVISALQAHIDGRTPQYSGEFRLRCKDGTWKWVFGRGRVILRDPHEKPLRVTGTIADISHRKAAEEREAHNLQLITQGAPSAAVLDAIVRHVEACHTGVRCSVMLVDPAGGSLCIHAAPTLSEEVKCAIDGLPVSADALCCGAAVHSAQRVVCANVLNEPRLSRFHELAIKAQLHACWSEPIISASGQVLGAFACYHREPHEPDHAEIRTITNAARLAALAIEREWREQALRISEERYARALRGTTDGLWDWNVVTGDVFLSPRWKEMLGFEANEMQYNREASFLSRLHPDDLPKVLAARKAHFERRQPYEVEMRLRTKSGEYRWFLARGQADWNDHNEPVRMTGTISDISERKEAEMKYRRELAYNQALVNHTSAFIVVMDVEGRFVHANSAFFSTMGYAEDEVVGRTVWEIRMMDSQEAERSKDRFARLLQGEDNPPTDVRLRTKSGEWRTVELRSTSTRHLDGSPDRIIITGTDVTERNRLQREVLRVIEQEQARVGHDLHDGVGQTMTGMVIMMESLEAELTGAAKEHARRIHELMLESVNEVRRMSHGLSPTSVKYRGLIGALNLLAETVRTNFRTPCTCELDAGICINDDDKEGHLFRIAQEAVNNALRHGRPSKIWISLKCVGSDECELRIEDDGSGIKKNRSREGGAGIGMRVMEYRANLIGGRLKLESRVRRGVVVTCRFVCKEGGRQASATSQKRKRAVRGRNVTPG